MTRWLVALLLVAGAIACDRSRRPAAPEGARPAVMQPVGPVPGHGDVANVVNPYANDADALEDGRRLFIRYNCSGCHGGHAGGGMGPSLRDGVWIYGGSDGQVFDSIAQGRANGMPEWGTRVPVEQIWQLTAYVKSLRTQREPDPPQ